MTLIATERGISRNVLVWQRLIGLISLAFLLSLWILAPIGAWAQSSGGCNTGGNCRVGTLTTTGNATIGGSLSVSGTLTYTNLSVTGTATVRGPLQLASGGTLAWSGTSLAQAPEYAILTASGTVPSALGVYAPLGRFLDITAGIDAHLNTGAAADVVTIASSSATNGALAAYAGNLTIGVTPAGTGEYEYFLGRFISAASAPSWSGAASGSEAGTIGGIVADAGLAAGGNYYSYLVSAEHSMYAAAGTNPMAKIGAYQLLYSIDVAVGRLVNTAYGIFNQFKNNAAGNSGGWAVGLEFGSVLSGLYQPISPTGWAIKFTPNPGGDNAVIGGVLNFASMTSCSLGQFLMLNWTLDCSGNITGQAATLTEILQNGSGGFQLVLSSATAGFFVKNSGGTPLVSVDTSGDMTIPGIFQAEFLRLTGGAAGYTAFNSRATTAIGILLPMAGGDLVVSNNATTSAIGGSSLAAGACASTTVSVSGAAVGQTVSMAPATYPGDAFDWRAYVSSSGTVTASVCARVAGTPTSSTYQVGVLQQ